MISLSSIKLVKPVKSSPMISETSDYQPGDKDEGIYVLQCGGQVGPGGMGV